MDESLRKDVKLLKALQGISYKEMASYVEITSNAFYNWLRNQYELSENKQKMLREVINTLRE